MKYVSVLLGVFAGSVMLLVRSPPVQAAWVPLVVADDFTGIKTDLLTSGAGIMMMLLVVLGIGILVKVLSR